MRSELGRIWPPPPLAGRGPNPPASLTGWRPSRGQLRRIRHPHGSDSASEPTPPKGGRDQRGQFARTRINFVGPPHGFHIYGSGGRIFVGSLSERTQPRKQRVYSLGRTQKSERLPVRDALASLTGKRPYYALASLTGKRPPHGDPPTGAREGGRRPHIYGRGTYGPVPPGAGAPPSRVDPPRRGEAREGGSPAPGGTGPTQFRLPPRI